jgi:hypothetical protein
MLPLASPSLYLQTIQAEGLDAACFSELLSAGTRGISRSADFREYRLHLLVHATGKKAAIDREYVSGDKARCV